MDTVLGLLRLALDRGWALGTLLVFFCGGTLAGTAYGLSLPPLLREWAAAGVLFGLAVVGVSVASHVLNWIGRWLSRRGARRVERAEEGEAAREALANLGALNGQELAALRDFLTDVPRRFEVDILSPAYGLLQKGVVVSQRSMGTSWICEVHPAIRRHRDEIVREIDARLSAI